MPLNARNPIKPSAKEDSHPETAIDGGANQLVDPDHSPHSVAGTDGDETWIQLCGLAAVEQDPKRLLELMSKINRLLEARKNSLAAPKQEAARKIAPRDGGADGKPRS